MPYRDFAHEAAERARTREPITFTLPGAFDDEGRPFNFVAHTTLAFGTLEDIAAAPEIHVDESAAVSAIRRFFTAVVIDEHADKLNDGLRASDPETLRDAMQWLVEEYSGRPTSPPSASQDGQPADGNNSTLQVAEREPEPSLT